MKCRRCCTLSIISILCCLFFNPIIAGECDNWQTNHPQWIWCDDFEGEQNLNTQYEDVSTSSGSFAAQNGDAYSGTYSLLQNYSQGQVDAGWIIKVNNDGFNDHVFMRWYHKFEEGFEGFPPKMGRLRYRDRSSWNTVFAVHCWLENDGTVCMDVSAENSSQANSSGWLPIALSDFTFSDAANIGRWICFEMEVLVNTSGQTDGLYRLWIDEELKIERTDVDLRGSTNDKINELMLDCYWNGGSPKPQKRYFDNFVASTEKIGPYDPSGNTNDPNKLKIKNKTSDLVAFNSVNGTVNFIVNPSGNRDFNLTVYTISGKKVWSCNSSSIEKQDNHVTWVNTPATGLYIARLQQKKTISLRRFTIDK